MALFEARGLTVKYGAVRALSNVDIDLEPGQIHGVIGPNGAGKSTLIDALSGRRRVTAGTVTFDGSEITGKSPRWRRHAGIARSFQRTSVFGSMTVREQLEMVARRTKETDLDSVVEAVELGSHLDRVCREIAYGTQRSVDLALALLGTPKVVLLDEPCAGLVAEESVRMLGHIRGLCQDRGVAALLVEHDVDGVFSNCDRVTVLNLGQLLVSGSSSDVRSDERVIRAYLGSAA